MKQAVGGLDVMLNDDCKDKDALVLIKYIAAEDRDEKVPGKPESPEVAHCQKW